MQQRMIAIRFEVRCVPPNMFGLMDSERLTNGPALVIVEELMVMEGAISHCRRHCHQQEPAVPADFEDAAF